MTKAPTYKPISFKTTEDIPVHKKIIEQVMGQDRAVDIIKKAGIQRRHILLIGDPGTGKSMLGVGLAELLSKEKLTDIVCFPNPDDENNPLVREVPAGDGKKLVSEARMRSSTFLNPRTIIIFIFAIIAIVSPFYMREKYQSDIMFAAFYIGGMMFLGAVLLFFNLGGRKFGSNPREPKILIDNAEKKIAPFYDGTGSHAGALLGDVLHDPFQSGGLGTPAHERVVAGLIHKTNKGVLFIDEIATLGVKTQQELLSALQEKKFAITGQSERSAGAMVRTEPVPCDFILVAAGNIETIQHLHPALRSRIRGYGYEVYMNNSMPDTPENQDKITIFISQEVRKDKKIPHFNKEAVESIIKEARRRANRKGHLTLRLRELGGIVRAAGDIATEESAKLVTKDHVKRGVKLSRSLEQQIADRYTERKKDYEIILTTGSKIGRVNGLAVMGGDSSFSGIILPIEAEVTEGGKKNEVIATGKLGEIAKEAITNVSAIVKKLFGKDIKGSLDIYVQFLQTYEGVEGDSASIAVATGIISALKRVPVKQEIAMTGSLSILGDVLPIGGVTSKIEAAIESGLKAVIVPKRNLQDIILDPDMKKKIKIIPVSTIIEVLEHAMDWKGKSALLKEIKKL